MFSFAMILIRDTIAARNRFGGGSTSCSTPSMRKRIRSLVSNASMWMSEARASTARVIIWLTSRITGASLARSFSRSTSTSRLSSSPSPTSSTTRPTSAAPSPYRRSIAASSSAGSATRGSSSRPDIRRIASAA